MELEDQGLPVRTTWAAYFHGLWLWLTGGGRRAMTSHEAVLARRVAALETSVSHRDEEADRLRAELRAANLERDMAKLENDHLHAIVARDRERVDAVTARYAGKTTRSELGLDE